MNGTDQALVVYAYNGKGRQHYADGRSVGRLVKELLARGVDPESLEFESVVRPRSEKSESQAELAKA